MRATNELFDLTGQVAIVTGGSRGLGLGMARTLATAGARVVITARKQDELDGATAELRHATLDVTAIRNDVASPSAADELVDTVLEQFGKIDVLVCNAGATWGAPSADLPRTAWDKVMDVNLHGTWALCQAVAARSMLLNKSGVIIIVASVAGLGGNPPGAVATVAYNTSKAAQINLARSLAAEWGPQGVRVNALLPGWFRTKMTQGTLELRGVAMEKRLPLGRLGDADKDLSGPVLFLASAASRYVTGHTLIVDGGMTALV